MKESRELAGQWLFAEKGGKWNDPNNEASHASDAECICNSTPLCAANQKTYTQSEGKLGHK